MAGEPEQRTRSLIDALRVVAAEPGAQRRALPALREVAAQIRRGEAVVELLDAGLVQEGLLPAEVGFLVQRIDELFDELVALDPAEAFAPGALATHPTWALMRALAREALTLLGAPLPLHVPPRG